MPSDLGAGAAMLYAEHAPTSGLAEGDFPHAARQPQANYAALDLGTNNCRLLIARPTRGGFRVVDAFSRIVRLGEGLATSGELPGAGPPPAAMSRPRPAAAPIIAPRFSTGCARRSGSSSRSSRAPRRPGWS